MYFQSSINYSKAFWGIHSMCCSLMLYTMIYQPVGCYGSLTGTYIIHSHLEWHLTVWILSLQEKQPPVGSGAVSAENQHDFNLVEDLSAQPLWVLTSTCRGTHLLFKAWLKSLNQESLWAEAAWGCTVKKNCAVPTA